MREAELRPYEEAHRGEVVELLSRAYLDNPLHLVVFGGAGEEQLRAHRTLFESSLPALYTGTKLVALDDRAVVGFAHWIPFPGCRPTPAALAELAPRLASELESDVFRRLLTWRRTWAEMDPEEPHSHFGPFAVDPRAQGRGIGRRLLQHYCEQRDRAGERAYLETERPANLAIYRKAGFEVAAECEVLGLPSWFMRRPAGGPVQHDGRHGQ